MLTFIGRYVWVNGAEPTLARRLRYFSIDPDDTQDANFHDYSLDDIVALLRSDLEDKGCTEN
jgi:hypothetical protein